MGATPEFIARYRIVRPLGQGGMGTLYLAEDPSLDRLIAIKLLKDDSAELRQRFIREARTAGRLRHVNIVSIFDVGEFDNQPFIAMEYIPGETLGEIIKRRAPLALTRKLVLMEELCAGLAYAHRAGIVHRDVKPANIMLDGEGTLKVLDFGIARVQSSGMTRSGMLMGSLNYMSPEMVNGVAVDQRSDLFAVGLVTYELLSYRKAFPGGLPEVLTRILHQKPDQFESVAATLDAELVQILERSLAKDPADRYENLVAMRTDLQRVRLRLERDADQQTIVLRRDSIKGAADAASRAAELADVVASAQSALDAMDIDTARTAIERARRLDAGADVVADLQDRLVDLVNLRQSQEWADEARQYLTDGALTAAYDLARRAEALTPADLAVVALLGDIERVRSQRDRERARQQAITSELGRARAAFDDGAFELALRITADVLALDPVNEPARSLSAQAGEAAERRRRQEHEEGADAALSEARALFDAGSREQAIEQLRGFAPAHVKVDEAIRSWGEELEEFNRNVRRSRAVALLRDGRTAIAREDASAAAAALSDLKELSADASEEAAALAGELQRLRDTLAERERVAGVFAQIETALNARNLDAVESWWKKLPAAELGSARLRPLIEGRQALRAALQLARQFDQAFATAKSAHAAQQLDSAREAITAALRLRPGEETAVALERQIDEGLAAREADRRAAAVREAVEQATSAFRREDLAAARASAERALALDAESAAAKHIAQEIEDTARRLAAERQALGLVAAAENYLSAGDLDRAASSLAQAKAVGSALAAIDAVDARIEAERRRLDAARTAADAARRAAELLEAGRTALAAEDLETAAATLEELRQLPAGAGQAATLAIELKRTRDVAAQRERVAGVIARIETALNDRRIEAVEPLWNELPKAERNSARLRPLLERWHQLKAAAELARQFDQALAKAAAALAGRQLDQADRAVRDALRLQPGDESALALQQQIGAAVTASQAEKRAGAAKEAIEGASSALRRKDLDAARTSVARALELDAESAAAKRIAREIEDAARRAAELRAAELVAAGRAALAREDFTSATAALDQLRQLPDVAGNEIATLATELRLLHEAAERRDRVADLIAQIETALDHQELDTAEATITQYQEVESDPEPVRPLIERWQESKAAAELARQFNQSVAKAASALKRRDLNVAERAIGEALRLRPDDESALALQQQIASTAPDASRRKSFAYLAAAALVVVLGGAGYYMRSGPETNPGPPNPPPLTTVPTTVPPTTTTIQPVPPPIVSGTATVDSTPFGRVTMKPLTAGVTLPKSQDTTPFALDLPAGRYEFTLEAAGLPSYKKIVDITAAGPNTVRLNHPAFDAGRIVSEILGAPKP